MIGRRMGPSVSALGVIAIAIVIVVLVITATASEVRNDVVEHGIDHPTVEEEERQPREDARIANNETSGNENASSFRENDTARDEKTLPRDQSYHLPSANHRDPNVSHSNVEATDAEIVELQRDQGDASAVSASPDDPRDTDRSPAGAGQRTSDANSPGSRMQDTTAGVYQTTTLLSQAEMTTSDRAEGQLPASRKIGDSSDDVRAVDGQGASNAADDGRRIDVLGAGKLNKDSWGSTITPIQETLVTETGPIEQKNVEDIRAISFQVPPPMTMDARETDGRERGAGWKEDPRRAGETRKDHSKPLNNLLMGGGKSTKAFYEIKPSIKTEMERSNDRLAPSSTQKTLAARKFVLPSVDSAFGKFGPYFEDGDQELNITARIGSTVLLDCKIGMLGDKEVTWVQHSKESFLLLTVGRGTYSVDQRISLNFRYPSNWRLQILYASPRDSGLYKCQVATHPPLVKKINVIVTAPELTITDDSGRIVPKERHLKAGSALKLRCEARDVLESLEESVVWTRGDETLTEDVSENRTLEITAGKEVLVIVSTLIVERASPRHAGNYSCVVPGKAKTTIAVHVLNGELPAAVHDVNGVSRAFFNLWLIYLTMSYVFSR